MPCSRSWRRYDRVVVTRRGKAIAELTPVMGEVPDLYGAVKGRVIVPPGVDLTEPVLEDSPEAEAGAIRTAAVSSGIFVSPVSAWEAGLLATRGRGALSFEPSAQVWFDDLLAPPGVRLIPLTHRAAIAASSLPGHSTGTLPIVI